MKTSEGWDLLSIGEIPTEKVQKNLKEISVFLSNDIRNIKNIVFQYHPLEVVKFAYWEQHRILRKKISLTFSHSRLPSVWLPIFRVCFHTGRGHMNKIGSLSRRIGNV